jgi:Fe-S-cluster containining protein
MKVTEQLAEQARQASQAMREHMLDALDHYYDQFKHADREQQPSPGGRAAGVHDAMTIWIDTMRANPPGSHTVQCRRGCASCCRLMVSVFPDEATLALIAAQDAGLELDRDLMRRQAVATNVDEWKRLPYADRACVFLRNEECAIYEHRPSSCRKYAVVTPPELCNTETHPGYQVGMAVSAMAEIITSAAISTWGFEGLAASMLKALGEPAQ